MTADGVLFAQGTVYVNGWYGDDSRIFEYPAWYGDEPYISHMWGAKIDLPFSTRAAALAAATAEKEGV